MTDSAKFYISSNFQRKVLRKLMLKAGLSLADVCTVVNELKSDFLYA
jgi:hypothetical protein